MDRVIVNSYKDKSSGKWVLGTPLQVWKEYESRGFLGIGRKFNYNYRYRPLGQDRNGDVWQDENNQHATDYKCVAQSYEELLDALLQVVLDDIKNGKIVPEKGKSYGKINYSSMWSNDSIVYVSSGKTANSSLNNLKKKVTEHIRRLKEDERYRSSHLGFEDLTRIKPYRL